jgi:ribosomal protein S12 methylthiotransferase accessory factor
MYEREFSSALAEEKIQRTAASLSLTFTSEYAHSSLVSSCALQDSAGQVVGEGSGKGLYCTVGAKAECLEHFALDKLSSDSLVVAVTNEIARQPLLVRDGVLANLPASHEMMDCVEVQDRRSGRTALIPAILQSPRQDFLEKINERPELLYLGRYASNSGVAFGCSEQEAILHGLNEVIERHTLSKVLMSLCGQHERLLLKSPDSSLLDAAFAGQTELRSLVEGMKILLVQTIHGVYFSMAIPKRPDGRHPICPLGSGCSLDARIAIERASTSCIRRLLCTTSQKKKRI